MPKDYYRGKPAPPSPPSTPPIRRKPSRSCIGWMVGGVALGVVGSQVLAPRGESPEDTLGSTRAGQSVPKPTFTYEKILSETEVDIGKGPPLPPPAPRPQPQVQPPPAGIESVAVSEPAPASEPLASDPLPPPTTPSPGTYVVQVASFSRPADAERLRERLTQLGLSTSVQTATLQNGKTAYRVRTGGYANRSEAEQVRALLKRHGQDGMTIPIK
jgi:cell division protein FtsN